MPIELSISFSDLPGLADVVRRAARREAVEYRLDGTIGVDAGQTGSAGFRADDADAGGPGGESRSN